MKLPEIGKRYKLKNHKTIVRVLPIVTVVDENAGVTIEYGVEIFHAIYEELPEEKKKRDEKHD